MRNTTRFLQLLALATSISLGALAPVVAQEPSFDGAAQKAEADLERSLAELARLREEIAEAKIPLNQELRELEARVGGLRRDAESASRQLDSTTLELGTLEAEGQGRQQEKSYLTNLLDEYARNFETRVHISELESWSDEISLARRAAEDADLSAPEAFRQQTALVLASLDRLENLLGGARFETTAIDADGRVREVTTALVGPLVLYRTEDGQSAGLLEQRIGSLEPAMVPLDTPADTAAVAALVQGGRGTLPLDPTLGSARKIEETQETWVEHILAGGPVMVPILLLALAAFVVAIAKWIQLSRVRQPSRRRVEALLGALKRRDWSAARAEVARVHGPTGEMLRAGMEHLHEPKELVEEVMYERVLETKLRLQSFLPFIAMAASAAPLLGLLGTVTGMINTFKMITVFGTGDAKTLSGGISEALITTEFGLIVAIPSLLLYAFLSRKARRMIDQMEKTAVSFLNRMAAGGGVRVGSIEEELDEEAALPAGARTAEAVYTP